MRTLHREPIAVRAARPVQRLAPLRAAPPRSAPGLLHLQRTAGNRAAVALAGRAVVLQRDAVDDWHGVGGQGKKRDPRLANVDLRVGQVRDEEDDGKLLYRLRMLVAALDDLTGQKYSKLKGERASLKADALARSAVVRQRIDDHDTARGNLDAHTRFTELPGQGGRFAGRQMDNAKLSNWGDPEKGSFKDLLGRPRDAHGGLTDTTVADWEGIGKDTIKANKKRFRTGGATGVGAEAARDFLLIAGPDPVTEKEDAEATQYAGGHPDLTNDKADERTVPRNVAGTSVSITYNQTDRSWQARVTALERAIGRLSRVVVGGIPAFQVYLPKFAKTVSKNAGGAIQVHDAGHRAEFVFPDTVFLAPSSMVPSVTTSISYEVIAEAVKKKKLAALEGVPTVVHELAHLVHYQTDPATFLGLTLTTIVGTDKKGNDRRAMVEQKVSEYGGGNPRELVAEVLTGLAFGRKYSKDIMEMYEAFGGPQLR